MPRKGQDCLPPIGPRQDSAHYFDWRHAYGWNLLPGYVEFLNCEKACLEAARGRGVNAVAVIPGGLAPLPERRRAA